MVFGVEPNSGNRATAESNGITFSSRRSPVTDEATTLNPIISGIALKIKDEILRAKTESLLHLNQRWSNGIRYNSTARNASD